MKRLIGAGIVLLAACGEFTDTPTDVETIGADAELVEERDVIVHLAPGLGPEDVIPGHVNRVTYRYRFVFNGFAATLSRDAIAGLTNNARVLRVDPDGPVWLVAEQSNPPWGLDRVDQRSLPLDGDYTYDYDGTGVSAYVVDTGIRYGHTDFEGRAVFGFDAFGGDGSDDNGHGTHVSGTTGGETYGIAKDVRLVSVKVLDANGSGTISGVIAGLDWIVENGQLPGVVNMSLGGGASSSLDDAVRSVFNDGFAVAVAAGNNGANACNYSPARVGQEALTVGASNTDDVRASFSNYGDCVDLFAPGVDIPSTWYTGDDATAVLSGTSMSSPHTAGAAALILEESPGASPSTVHQTVLDRTTKDIVTNSLSARNNLLYTLATDGGGNDPPDAGFSYGCDGLTCAFTDESTDPDGDALTHLWEFGDGATSTAENPTHDYAVDGSYDVTLTVTDPDGLSDAITKTVSVSEAAITLSVAGDRVQGRHTLYLSWSSADGATVTILLNDNVYDGSAVNDGAYTVATDNRGSGSYAAQVCENVSSECSPVVTYTF